MIRFAVFTDLHYDYIPDGDRRISELINKISNEKLDFIICLGDLCFPIEENKKVIEAIEHIGVPVYYAIGNNDLYNFNLEQVVRFYNMSSSYYSFIIDNTKFIVLNSNYAKKENTYIPFCSAEYDGLDTSRYIPDYELRWLNDELSDDNLNYVIFSHHSLINEASIRGIKDNKEIQEVLKDKNILISMNGHVHGDDIKIAHGIPFFTVNSMSYIFTRARENLPYDEETIKKYPILKQTLLFKDSLSCIVEIDQNGVSIHGMTGDYQSLSPKDIGESEIWNGISLAPRISDFQFITIPLTIKKIIGDREYHIDDIGQSASQVICFDDMVLKIEETGENSDNEHRMLTWLNDKLPVPEILHLEKSNNKNYLLMSKIDGDMSCTEELMNNPEKLVCLLAEGLKMLWSIDINECPYNNATDHKLMLAEQAINNGLCDIDDAEPNTYGENGFENPAALLKWLKENKPDEKLVFSHGDYCLPNIFIKNGRVNGFIDLGNSGIADKYQDIALCYRSLMHNYRGKYAKHSDNGLSGKLHSEFNPDSLFDMLNIKPDWDKIRYYILLDELS